MPSLPDQEWECIVVGGGAAGLNAALVLGRARRRVLVLDAGDPLNARAPHMQGFLSRDGTPPLELLRIGRAELESYGVPVVAARVSHVARVPGTGDFRGVGRSHFHVSLEGGERLRARRLILAHGMRLLLPEVSGLREVWGDTAANCPYCHGWEVRDRPLAVLGVPTPTGEAEPAGMPGAGARAVHLGSLLTQWSADVIVFPNGVEIDAAGRARLAGRGVRVDDRPVARLAVEEGRLAGVVVGTEEECVPREALFVAAAPAPQGALLAQFGAALLPSGWPEIDANGKTSVPGVWAVGQAAEPMHQVIGAAASGARAAAFVNADLLEETIEMAERSDRHAAHPGPAGHAGHAGHGASHRHGHAFDQAHVARLLGEERRAELPPEETLHAAGVTTGQTVVDLGCGPGYLTLPAAELVGPRGKVYGVDVQPEMLEVCRARAAEAGVQIEVVRSTASDVPLPGGISDVVLVSLVLHETADPAAFLREARRLLKPEGEVALVELRKQPGDDPRLPRLSEGEIATAVEGAGLRVRERRELNTTHLLFRLSAAAN